MYEVIDELPGHFLKQRQESHQSTKSKKGNVKNDTRHKFNMPVSEAINPASQFAWKKTSFADPDLGSGAFVNPWIRNPEAGWGKNPDPDQGSEMSILDDFSESLETVFGLKILKFFEKKCCENLALLRWL
jgi:hypothetical protein